jgi:type IV pilus assembly protein PilO
VALESLLEPIVNASPAQKIALGTIAVAAIVGFAYFFMISPEQGKVAVLEAQNRGVQAELQQARTALTELMRFRRETADVERTLEATREKLPTEREIPPLYRTLSESAFQAGLEVAVFQPKEPKAQDYYTEIPIAMGVEGGYHQLGKFFEKVATIPRIVTISDLKVVGMPKSRAVLHADLVVSTYVYRPVGSQPVSKKAPDKK